MKLLRSVPVAFCGLALAVAALGNLLHPYGEVIRYICGILATVILIMFILKIILDFSHVREEFKTPIALSALPTSTMAVMLLSAYARPYAGVFAVFLWYAVIVIHVCIMLFFFKRFILGFKLDTVFPSWFITFVGIAAASVTAPVMGNILIGQIAFYFGLVLYFIVLLLVIYRMIKVKMFPEPAYPTIAICTAPVSLLIAGYANSFVQQGRQNDPLIYLMLAIAALSYVYVTIKMISLLRAKFYPTYAAFTFPYVISATAFRFGAAFLAERGINFFNPVASISEWIAVAVVVYVLARYVLFFRKQINI